MNILVCIAYYGTENQEHVTRLIEAYNSSEHQVDIVVASEAPKNILVDDPNAFVQRIGLPLPDPFTLPYVHKHLFRKRADDYDLFIYTEDDTLISDHNIEAFLWATELLDDDHIAGFLRTETTPEGIVRCSSVHSHFHWRPDSAASVRRPAFRRVHQSARRLFHPDSETASSVPRFWRIHDAAATRALRHQSDRSH